MSDPQSTPDCCGNCRFAFWWMDRRTGDGLPFGECRRFPSTERKRSDEWCGEHKPPDDTVNRPATMPSESDDDYRARIYAKIGPGTVHQEKLFDGDSAALDEIGSFYEMPRK